MKNVEFTYKGLTFQIVEFKFLNCGAVSIAIINDQTTLEQIKTTCDEYLNNGV